ncbi:hypothetical protein T484DRAFT_3624850 [Baffinella frigidus]|nr:hypothetical protein T484DRAFT_3624850 [Cryptophyta sp. CCMP2293]
MTHERVCIQHGFSMEIGMFSTFIFCTLRGFSMILVLRNVHICVFYFCQIFYYQARASALRRSPAPCPPLACHVLTCPLGCPQPLWAPAFHRISQAISSRFFHRKKPPRPPRRLVAALPSPAQPWASSAQLCPALGIVCPAQPWASSAQRGPARPSAALLWAGRCWRVGTGGYRTGGRRQAGGALRGGSATDFRPRPPAGMAGAGLLLAGAGPCGGAVPPTFAPARLLGWQGRGCCSREQGAKRQARRPSQPSPGRPCRRAGRLAALPACPCSFQGSPPLLAWRCGPSKRARGPAP